MTLSSIKCFLSTSLEFTVGKTGTAEEGGGVGTIARVDFYKLEILILTPREAGGVSMLTLEPYKFISVHKEQLAAQ